MELIVSLSIFVIVMALVMSEVVNRTIAAMVEAGLLNLTSDGLTIEQVIGRTLKTDMEALTPITKEVLDSVNAVETVAAPAPAAAEKKAPVASAKTSVGGNGMIHADRRGGCQRLSALQHRLL